MYMLKGKCKSSNSYGVSLNNETVNSHLFFYFSLSLTSLFRVPSFENAFPILLFSFFTTILLLQHSSLRITQKIKTQGNILVASFSQTLFNNGFRLRTAIANTSFILHLPRFNVWEYLLHFWHWVSTHAFKHRRYWSFFSPASDLFYNELLVSRGLGFISLLPCYQLPWSLSLHSTHSGTHANQAMNIEFMWCIKYMINEMMYIM